MLQYFPVFDLTREKAQKLKAELEQKHYGHIVDSPAQADAILVAGGDGFMLDTIKKYCYHYTHSGSHNPIFFGINCGTLGFLLNDIHSLAYLPENRESMHVVGTHLLQVEIQTKKEQTVILHAINDVVIGGNIADYFRFHVATQDDTWDIVGTGLLFANPIGTTAYWLGNGGPLIPTGSHLIGMMGIATRPFYYKTLHRERIEITPVGRTTISCVVDGYAGKVDDVTKIILSPTESEIHIGFMDNFEHKRILLAEQKM